ncbi:MAG: guanylate kinase [Firmicutes bacterium]|nr:guanylate kinase [Bacillota bacterium]
METNKRGILLVVSGPSGVGKGTICGQLLQELQDIQFSISVTTRAPRPNEQDGVNYYFITEDEFQSMRAAGELLEWAEVFGNYYGTPRKAVEKALDEGKDILLEIDIQGAVQVKAAFPECVLVFVWPPSYQELERRIRQRGTETPESLSRRLRKAKLEMSHVVNYDYVVVNQPGQVAAAVKEIEAILIAEKARVARLMPWLQQSLKEV